MKKTLKYTLATLLMLLLTLSLAAQTVESLNRQIQRAEQEIAKNTALLNQYKKNQQVNERQLKLIRSRMDNRREIVSSLEQQIGLIDRDIEGKNRSVGDLQQRLEKLKEEYADMIYAAYKNFKLNNALVFLFAAQDFNDATIRVNYMRRYNRMREQKAVEIDSLTRKLTVQITDLDQQRTVLDKKKETRRRELASLQQDESQYRTANNRLRKNAATVQKKIKAKQAEKQRAQQKLQQIVAEEARRSQAAKRSTAERAYDVALTGRFDENMGKLPYPVQGGVIIDRYGKHPHPTQRGLVVNNKGVNIAASRGAQVRCVFEGVVTRILFIPGLNNSVMVRHGNYITVYANLAAVSVKKDQKVALNQVLGTLSSGEDSEDYTVHFEIWKETTNLNPESWLRK